MEIIDKPIVKVDEDYLARRVFYESINIIGGLKKLIDYRNLTWLPSLAEASYVVVLSKEFFYSVEQIAEKLGLSKNTVKNILSSDENEVKSFLEGKIEKVDEHKAGGIAKLAYKAVKEKKDLYLSDEEVDFLKSELKKLHKEWAIYVLINLKGTKFPIDKETFLSKLNDIIIEDFSVKEISEYMSFPLNKPSEVLHQIKVALEKIREKS